MAQSNHRLEQPVTAYAQKDFTVLRQELSVQETLDAIRQRGVGEKIVYFYVVDDEERLVGVLPTRRLLMAPVTERLSAIMIARVVSISHSATVMDACELFVMHMFLAFPVVDDEQHVVGVVSLDLLTNEVFDIAEREQMDDLFEAIGFHIQQVRDASAFRAFRYRFPWLLATIGSGLLCAVLASAFALTLTIQALRTTRPTLRWYADAFRREGGTALLLGLACGSVVGLFVWLWRGGGLLPIVVGGSIALSLCVSCLAGLSVPAILHALKLDPKISAGPITLALADIATLLFYLTLATVVW